MAQPIKLTEDVSLADHAVEIRRLVKRAGEDLIETGRRLTICKALAGHGGWLAWLDREFGWTDDTALNFMHVYEMSKTRNFRDLHLPASALYLLAEPATPEAARDEVFERAEDGERLRVRHVRQIVEEHKVKLIIPYYRAVDQPVEERTVTYLSSSAVDQPVEQKTIEANATPISLDDDRASLHHRHARDPSFVHYQEWLAATRKVIDDTPSDLRNTTPMMRKKIVAELSNLSARIDWLRAAFHDIDREAG
jgi:Protein of unknown function (DUF3102)